MKNKFHVQITPELIKRAQERIDHIINEGCVHSGVSDKFDSNAKPAWFDEERFKKAQQIAKEFHVPIGNSSLIGLFLVLQLPIGLLPLLATGQSKNVSKLFSRYLNTILHVNSWYKHDPFDPQSKAYKSQQMVKTMHRNAGKLMNSKISIYDFVKKMIEETTNENNNNTIDVEKFIKRKERTWVSQADMALTQWAFIGVLIIEPYSCGMHAGSKEFLVEIAYIWRVLGHKIGIEDQFNLFNDLDFDLIYTMSKLVLEQHYIPFVENVSSPMGIAMVKGTVQGLRPLLPYVRFKSYLKFWYKTLNINSYKLNSLTEVTDKYEFLNKEIKTELTEEERKLMLSNGYNDKYIVPNPNIPFEELKLDEFIEKFCYNLYLFNVNTMFKAKFFRNLSRKTNKGRANRALRKKNEHMDYMAKKFDEKNQYPACPFAGNIDNDYFEYADVK